MFIDHGAKDAFCIGMIKWIKVSPRHALHLRFTCLTCLIASEYRVMVAHVYSRPVINETKLLEPDFSSRN